MHTITLLLAAALAEEPPPATVVASSSVEETTAPTVSSRLVVVPGVGWNAAPNAQVDGLSIGAITLASAVDGVDAALWVSWVDGAVHGVQLASVATLADGFAEVQGAGVVAAADTTTLQVSGFVSVARHVEMAQLSGGVNVAKEGFEGAQLSALNVAGGASTGVQGSLLNVAGDLEGVQIGLLNIGGGVAGLQVGLVNVARSATGQVGLVNLAKRVDGEAVGLLSLSGNGLHELEVWGSDSAVGNVSLKLGGRYLYTLGGLGWVGVDQPYFTYGLGMGVQVPAGELFLATDLSAWAVQQEVRVVPGVLTKWRVSVGLPLAKELAPFVGLSANTWVGDGRVVPRAVGLPSFTGPRGRLVTWPGFHVGVQL